MLQHVAPEVGCSFAVLHLHLAGFASFFAFIKLIFCSSVSCNSINGEKKHGLALLFTKSFTSNV